MTLDMKFRRSTVYVESILSHLWGITVLIYFPIIWRKHVAKCSELTERIPKKVIWFYAITALTITIATCIIESAKSYIYNLANEGFCKNLQDIINIDNDISYF